MAVNTKEWYKSKTLWVGVLTVAMGIFEYLQGQISTGASITVIGVVNIALRLVTTQAVKLGGE